MGITILVGGFMKEEQKLKIDSKQLSSDFSADIAPVYNDRKKRNFKKQGKRSFLDEFHTFYRKWIKNE